MPTPPKDRVDAEGKKTSGFSSHPWTNWLVVAVPSILIVGLNLLSAILANETYVPHYYRGVYNAMTLEDAGVNVVIAMLWVFPPQLLTQTVSSLIIGGAIGAGLGCVGALASHAPPARIGAAGFVVSTLTMAIASVILPFPQRHDLSLLGAQFLDLLDTHAVQYACQYGGYPLAILHLNYFPALLVLAALSFAATLSTRLALAQKWFKG
jgi:hypothetical protein